MFKGYSAIASNYEDENIPSNTLIFRVGNTLKLCIFLKRSKFEKILRIIFSLYMHFVAIYTLRY